MVMAPSQKQDGLLFHQETKQEGGPGKKKGLSKKQRTESGELCSHVLSDADYRASGQQLWNPTRSFTSPWCAL